MKISNRDLHKCIAICPLVWLFASFSLSLNLFSANIYASPTSGEAYRDRRLTTYFELWVEIFCVPTCFHMRIPKPCLSVCPSVHLSVCPHLEKRNPLSFVNISPTLVIDTSMERSSRVLQHGNQKICFFFKKVRNWIRLLFWLVLKSWNHSSGSPPICRHRGCIVVPLRVDI